MMKITMILREQKLQMIKKFKCLDEEPYRLSISKFIRRSQDTFGIKKIVPQSIQFTE